MKIFLLRHGETNHNVLRVASGYTITTTGNDVLSKLGKKQAKNVAAKIKDIPFEKIFVSPLLRTRQTAEIILSNAKFNCEAIYDKRIIEHGHIRYEMLPKEYLATYQSPNGIDRELFHSLTGGQETMQETYERLNSFFVDLKTQKDGNYLLIAHGAIIALIQCYFDGLPVTEWREKWRTMALTDNCELRIIEI